MSPLNRGGISHRYWPDRRRDDKPFRDQYERIVETLKLGIDDWVSIDPPFVLDENVKFRIRKERPVAKYPLLIKEYETPRGTLSKIVRQSYDWPHGDDIPLFDDYGVSSARSIKDWVEKDEDLDALECMFREPNELELEAYWERADEVRKFADENEVAVLCSEVTNLGGAAMWLCGFVNTVLLSAKRPDFLNRLLDLIHGWDMMKAKLMLEVGDADVIVHYGWYDSTDFWSTKAYGRFLQQRLKEEIDLVHKQRTKFGYTMASGAMPLIGAFKEMGIDLLYRIDPVQGGYDLGLTKREIGDRVCLWGGVNSHITLTLGNREDVRNAVREAISKLNTRWGLHTIKRLYDDISADTNRKHRSDDRGMAGFGQLSLELYRMLKRV
ncbi:MAG: uroporphyrinogen decarboxylase family protein [Thermoproteota archaeon]